MASGESHQYNMQPDLIAAYLNTIRRGFGALSLDEAPVSGISATLLTEQREVQATKCTERLVEEYDEELFPGGDSMPTAVVHFLRPFCRDGIPTLENLLAGIHEIRKRPIRWVDMGGGRSLPMRKLAPSGTRDRILPTNVDLFDWGTDYLKQGDITYFESIGYDLTSPDSSPPFVQADMTTVVLPEKGDIITSVENVQFLDHPLAAITNWYNQLTNDGILIITTAHYWSDFMHYQNEPHNEVGMLSRDLLAQLQRSGISFAKADIGKVGDEDEADSPRLTTLVVRRTPGTSMRYNGATPLVRPDTDGYKETWYTRPAGGRPLIEVS